MSNHDTILKRILDFLKINSIWTMIGAIAAVIGIPTTIWAIKEHNLKSDIHISVSHFQIPENDPCNIYYLVPQEYFEGPMGCSFPLEICNTGGKDLQNIKVMIDASSVYDTKPSFLFSGNNSRTVEQQELRFRRIQEQEHYDAIEGERIIVSYNGFSERLDFVCRNLPKGLEKHLQPRFNVDRSSYIYARATNEGIKGNNVYDTFFIDISYAATNVPAKKIERIPIIVSEEVSIENIIHFYEEEGYLFGATMFDLENVERGYVNNIIIYPHYFIENNQIMVSIDDADCYYIKFDTSFKNKKKRKITILNLKNLEVNSYEFKDTPERRDRIKKYYEVTLNGLKCGK